MGNWTTPGCTDLPLSAHSGQSPRTQLPHCARAQASLPCGVQPNDYRDAMPEAVERATDRPCEDCGAQVIAGQEPIDPAFEDPDVVATGVTMVGSEWCTNLDCPSNHRPRGLHRVGVNRYICDVCNEVLAGRMSAILAHRRTH